MDRPQEQKEITEDRGPLAGSSASNPLFSPIEKLVQNWYFREPLQGNSIRGFDSVVGPVDVLLLSFKYAYSKLIVSQVIVTSPTPTQNQYND